MGKLKCNECNIEVKTEVALIAWEYLVFKSFVIHQCFFSFYFDIAFVAFQLMLMGFVAIMNSNTPWAVSFVTTFIALQIVRFVAICVLYFVGFVLFVKLFLNCSRCSHV